MVQDHECEVGEIKATREHEIARMGLVDVPIAQEVDLASCWALGERSRHRIFLTSGKA